MSESGSSAVSRTSTMCYADQESFSTFIIRVKILCSTDLWPETPSEAITIERMRGGSNNRVIGITVSASKSPSENKSEAYVLRIPRGKSTRIEQELATLCFVRNRTTIPVPAIVKFDLTSNNPIGEKYNLQQRIPGVPLFDVYMKISQSERLAIVRQLAYILLDMHEPRSPTPGFLNAAKLEDGKLVPDIRIVDFRIKTFMDFAGETLWGGMEDDSAHSKSTFQLFIDQFDAWQRFGQNCNRGEEEDELMERFRKVTQKMESLRLLPEEPYVLFHPDFAPQNILVHKMDEDTERSSGLATATHVGTQDNQSEWKISGILDWDGAAFAPYSVACTPLSWIWSDWNGDEEDEAVLCKTPDDPEARERKELFDGIMGPSYIEHAYSDDYRFVRKLFEFATDGFIYSHRYADAVTFFEEWEKTVLKIEKISLSVI